jgi:hypothetical protein
MVTTAIKENNQAIFIGGFDPDQAYDAKKQQDWFQTKDEWPQGIGVFDMTKSEMKNKFSADAPPYTAPDIVRETYDNG